MAEMNAVSRFFVNRCKARANQRVYDWVRENVSIPDGARCLEIGCGNANMAVRIFDGMRPGTYLATDLDLRQIDAAERYVVARYPAGPPAGLELRTADMMQLPFPERSFDVVFAFSAIHHASPNHHDFSNLPSALAEVDRVLRPGGLMVYEEFVHKARIRGWLQGHGYTVIAHHRRFTRETNVVRKLEGEPVAESRD